MKLALVLLLASAAANAQEARCPQLIESPQKAMLMAGAIRVGPAEDRVELAGGDTKEFKGGYDVIYRFLGHEIKWLMCAYGRDGEIQRFQRMDERATKCKLQVRESKREVSARMSCE